MDDEDDNRVEWSPSSSNFDVSVMRTAQDAVKAKNAAVQAGYYRDPYIGAFAGIRFHRHGDDYHSLVRGSRIWHFRTHRRRVWYLSCLTGGGAGSD